MPRGTCLGSLHNRPAHVGPGRGHLWAYTHVSMAEQEQRSNRVAVIIRAECECSQNSEERERDTEMAASVIKSEQLLVSFTHA